MPTVLAGEHALPWGGRARSYLLAAPPDADPAAALPLVIALHGAGQDAGSFAWETQFVEAAAAQRMLVAFPNGSGTEDGRLSWNAHFCCGVGAAEQVDDIGFIGALLDDIAKLHAVDRKRVYATGMSNGGMLAYQFAAAHPEWFAVIAPVSAAIGGTSRSGERFVIAPPDRPVPVMIIHGRRDPYVLYDGGGSITAHAARAARWSCGRSRTASTTGPLPCASPRPAARRARPPRKSSPSSPPSAANEARWRHAAWWREGRRCSRPGRRLRAGSRAGSAAGDG
jgi:poly(3-hydroxybutyrate) depolymerase